MAKERIVYVDRTTTKVVHPQPQVIYRDRNVTTQKSLPAPQTKPEELTPLGCFLMILFSPIIVPLVILALPVVLFIAPFVWIYKAIEDSNGAST